MTILVVDGQGGNIGRQLVKMIAERFPQETLLAVGTNSIATANMLKAAPIKAATGENAVVVASRKADIIVGPLAIVITDALLGEVTQTMATAIARSDAARILIPLQKCDNMVAGIQNASAVALLEDAMEKIASQLKKPATKM